VIPAQTQGLRGRRVLVVEDEPGISIGMEEMLSDAGCIVIGPADTVAGALAHIQDQRLDGAVLDVNLAGEAVLPVADRLEAAGIPFLFTTGYDDPGQQLGAHDARPVLCKPFSEGALVAALVQILTR
jgi:CheY-like chemotaxis protein